MKQVRQSQRDSDNCERVIRSKIRLALGSMPEPAEPSAKRACLVPSQAELDATPFSKGMTLGRFRSLLQLPTCADVMAAEYSPVTVEGYRAFWAWVADLLTPQSGAVRLVTDPSEVALLATDPNDDLSQLEHVVKALPSADHDVVVTGMALLIVGAEPNSDTSVAGVLAGASDLWQDLDVDCACVLEDMLKEPLLLQKLVAMDLVRHRGIHDTKDLYVGHGTFHTLATTVLEAASYGDTDGVVDRAAAVIDAMTRANES